MVHHDSNPPMPGRRLFENLFVRRSEYETLQAISLGLNAVLSNASRLIKDTELLISSGRYPSAAFLLATADEEMAKSYILIDACRVDFEKRQSVLKRLCRAFYDHGAKHAYNEIVRHSGFTSLSHVKEMWDIKVTRWWPSFGTGEPAMPDDTFFAREIPLYADFIDQSQGWFTPTDETSKYIFEGFMGTDALSESMKALERLQKTAEVGLYRPECLLVLNRTLRNHYFKETTPTSVINRVYEKTVQRIETELGITSEHFKRSALAEWPLYHFVADNL